MARRNKPLTNENGRRKSFYSKALDEAEKIEQQEASGIEGLDHEIALLRLKLRELLEDHPDKIELQLRAANAVARLVHTRYQISAEQKKNLKDAITTVLLDVAIPLGIQFLP